MQRFDWRGRGTSFICVMVPLLVILGLSARDAPDLRGGALTNPDTYMRLVRLRDMLHHGAVLDAVARDGSGHGTVLHWSHLIDGLVCLFAVPFGIFLKPDDALHAAALVFGPLNIAALGFAVAWAAAPFSDRKWLWLGAVLPALSPAIGGYGLVGVVHHHVAAVVVAVACWGWAARLIAGHARSDAGIALGVWAALGIWLTPETVPLSMAAFGALFLAWLGRTAREGIARAIGLGGLSFGLVTLLALFADPPASGIGAMEIDRLSLLFASLAVALAGAAAGLWAADALIATRRPRIAAACAIGSICAAAWIAMNHATIFRANPLLGADQSEAMFGHIMEMLPIGDLLAGLRFLLTGVWALLILMALAVRYRSPLLGYVSIWLAGSLVFGGSHVRFAAWPEAAAAIAFPVALTLLSGISSRWHQIGRSFACLATILLFVQLPLLEQMPELTGSAWAAPSTELPRCAVNDAAAMLSRHPDEVVLADVDDTPELLYRTRVRTVGSLYHRGIDGFMRLRAAWRVVPSATVPPEIDAAEISLVLACRTPARSALVMDLPEVTLFDRVRTARPPPWLKRIDENPASGQVLYKVVRRDAETTADR